MTDASPRHGAGSQSPPPSIPAVGGGYRRPGGPGRRRAALVVLGMVVVVIAALATVAGVAAWHRPSAQGPAPTPGVGGPTHSTVSRCQSAFIPAFFSPGARWTQAISGKPSVMILDITTTGAGTVPDPGLQAEARRAQAAKIKVIGYISTDYGKRPAAQVEADVRNYKAWYGVSGIFLDLAAEGPSQLGYYRGLADYIRQVDPGATVWLNPGLYPDQRYLAIANVVMVFEGPYANYIHQQPPSWAHHYPADRFAHTVFATPGSQMANAVRLSKSMNAGYLYVTDQAGANPYDGPPSYWAQETAAVRAGCAHA